MQIPQDNSHSSKGWAPATCVGDLGWAQRAGLLPSSLGPKSNPSQAQPLWACGEYMMGTPLCPSTPALPLQQLSKCFFFFKVEGPSGSLQSQVTHPKLCAYGWILNKDKHVLHCHLVRCFLSSLVRLISSPKIVYSGCRLYLLEPMVF